MGFLFASFFLSLSLSVSLYPGIDFRVAPSIDVAAAMMPAKAGTTTLTVAAAKKAAEVT